MFLEVVTALELLLKVGLNMVMRQWVLRPELVRSMIEAAGICGLTH